MVCACRVVVLAARGVGEGVVGVVYLLEFFGPGRAFWGVRCYAVGVGFQGLPVFEGEVLVTGFRNWGAVEDLYRCLLFVGIADL